jgi:hypothetical protein
LKTALRWHRFVERDDVDSVDERLQRAEAGLAELRTRLDQLAAGKFDLITLSTGLNVVDAAGRIRATLRLVEDGLGLAFWSSGGQMMLSISCDDSPRISLYDDAGCIRAVIKSDDSGPLVSLNDQEGNPRLTASVLDDAPRLMLHDQERLRLALAADPCPSLEMRDGNEVTRIGVGLNEGSVPTLGMFDLDGQPRVLVGLDGDQEPAVVFYDQDESIMGMINEAGLELIGLHASQHRGE